MFKKSSLICLLAIMGLISVSSCKKDDPEPAVPTLEGFWVGKYGSGANTYPDNGYAALFRSNGTVRVFDGADTTTASKAEGTYTLTGSELKASYTYMPSGSKFSFAAIVDSKFTFLEGTWGSADNTTNGGRWFMNKK